MEAMICSMTFQGRRNPHLLNARRRERIAKGSGVTLAELNTVLNRFAQMQQIMKKMGEFQKMMAQMGGGRASLRRRLARPFTAELAPVGVAPNQGLL